MANLSDDILAVHIGKAKIEQNQIRLNRGTHAHCLFAAIAFFDAEIGCIEKYIQHLTNLWFVVDDQNSVFCVCHVSLST